MYSVLTELTVVLHLLFILFVIGGGFIARRWRWLTAVHLTAVAWGIYAELAPGIVCPLTTLENYFAHRAGMSTYEEGFISRYLVPIIYQDEITPALQYLLVALVLVVNAVAYATIRSSEKTKGHGKSHVPPG
jgi:hypothetical protein